MAFNVPPFAALRALDAIARQGGIRRAADSLGISHAAVSRHLRGLEQHVGATLFNRMSGRLTPVGLQYHARVAGALAEISAATDMVRDDAAARLVISCSSGLALHWLTPRLMRFTQHRDAPAIELRALDTPPALATNEVDGDLRYVPIGEHAVPTPDVTIVELVRPPVFPVAAPTVAQDFHRGKRSAARLVDLPLIEEGGDDEWRRWLAAQNVNLPTAGRRARYGHAHLALAAARMGHGVALANDYIVQDDLEQGRLVKLCGDPPFAEVPLGAYAFLTHQSRSTLPSLVRFGRWLIAEMQSNRPGFVAGSNF